MITDNPVDLALAVVTANRRAKRAAPIGTVFFEEGAPEEMMIDPKTIDPNMKEYDVCGFSEIILDEARSRTDRKATLVVIEAVGVDATGIIAVAIISRDEKDALLYSAPYDPKEGTVGTWKKEADMKEEEEQGEGTPLIFSNAQTPKAEA
jgi:hypothetical protein